LIENAAGRRASSCSHCGAALHEMAAARPGVSQGAIGAAPDPWLRQLIVRIYCRVLLVLMIYVLSTGPLYWAIYESFTDNGSFFLARLYYPLVLACKHSEVVCNWFDWYVGLWVN
jgi:hypothetical protein